MPSRMRSGREGNLPRSTSSVSRTSAHAAGRGSSRTREDNQKAAPQGVAGDCRMVPRAPARCCERATENPECQAPRPLPILRATDELSLSLVVLSEGPSYLAGVAESPHARAMADVGEICGNPATASVVATADHALLGGCGEHGLKNPLREICTVGSVRGEIMGSHGGLKRADSVGIKRRGVANERVAKKGIANHIESESCEGVREGALEALTGAY